MPQDSKSIEIPNMDLLGMTKQKGRDNLKWYAEAHKSFGHCMKMDLLANPNTENQYL